MVDVEDRRTWGYGGQEDMVDMEEYAGIYRRYERYEVSKKKKQKKEQKKE